MRDRAHGRHGGPGRWLPLPPAELASARAFVGDRGALEAHLVGAISEYAARPSRDGLWAWWAGDGVRGLALVSDAVYLCCDDGVAAARFARLLADRQPAWGDLVCPSGVAAALVRSWRAASDRSVEGFPLATMVLSPPMPAPGRSAALELRCATTAELATVMDFEEAAWRHEHDDDMTEDRRSRLLPAVLAQLERRREYLGFSGREPVFHASVVVDTPEVALVEGIHVAAHRRNRGVGRRAMQILCGRLLRRHAAVVLMVRRDNVPAMRLYARLGFRDAGRSHVVRQTAAS